MYKQQIFHMQGANEVADEIVDRLMASFTPCDGPALRGDCGQFHATFEDRLGCRACAHAIATNSRPWMCRDARPL